jgi:hypothetical protein
VPHRTSPDSSSPIDKQFEIILQRQLPLIFQRARIRLAISVTLLGRRGPIFLQGQSGLVAMRRRESSIHDRFIVKRNWLDSSGDLPHVFHGEETIDIFEEYLEVAPGSAGREEDREGGGTSRTRGVNQRLSPFQTPSLRHPHHPSLVLPHGKLHLPFSNCRSLRL